MQVQLPDAHAGMYLKPGDETDSQAQTTSKLRTLRISVPSPPKFQRLSTELGPLPPETSECHVSWPRVLHLGKLIALLHSPCGVRGGVQPH